MIGLVDVREKGTHTEYRLGRCYYHRQRDEEAVISRYMLETNIVTYAALLKKSKEIQKHTPASRTGVRTVSQWSQSSWFKAFKKPNFVMACGI